MHLSYTLDLHRTVVGAGNYNLCLVSIYFGNKFRCMPFQCIIR
jgi:hypothetical protein